MWWGLPPQIARASSGVIDLLSYARVAKWQTRRLQVPVPARAWGFKSPLAHVSKPAPTRALLGGAGSLFAPMYDVVPQTQYETDGELAFRVNGALHHAAVTRADLVAEVRSWGYGPPEGLINETLEAIRALARAETPHASAEPTIQDAILGFTQNLLDGRAAGSSH